MTMHEVFCMHRTTVSKIRKQKLTGSEVAGKASAIILPALHRPWEAKTQQILKYSLPSLEGTASAKHYYIKPTTPSTPSHSAEKGTPPRFSPSEEQGERKRERWIIITTF